MHIAYDILQFGVIGYKENHYVVVDMIMQNNHVMQPFTMSMIECYVFYSVVEDQVHDSSEYLIVY